MTPERTLRELVELIENEPPFGHDAGPKIAGDLYDAWRAAEGEATVAYEAWKREPGVDAYTVYLAAEERASAAQDALAEWVRAGQAWRQAA